MQVWIAEAGYDYSNGHILGVFSSEEKARDRIKELNDDRVSDFDWDSVTLRTVDA